MNHPFRIFERQIAEEKSMIKELEKAFDIVADKLVVAEQRERDLKALLTRAADALEQEWCAKAIDTRELIDELRKAA